MQTKHVTQYTGRRRYAWEHNPWGSYLNIEVEYVSAYDNETLCWMTATTNDLDAIRVMNGGPDITKYKNKNCN